MRIRREIDLRKRQAQHENTEKAKMEMSFDEQSLQENYSSVLPEVNEQRSIH